MGGLPHTINKLQKVYLLTSAFCFFNVQTRYDTIVDCSGAADLVFGRGGNGKPRTDPERFSGKSANLTYAH